MGNRDDEKITAAIKKNRILPYPCITSLPAALHQGTAGECKVGIMPGFVFKAGKIDNFNKGTRMKSSVAFHYAINRNSIDFFQNNDSQRLHHETVHGAGS